MRAVVDPRVSEESSHPSLAKRPESPWTLLQVVQIGGIALLMATMLFGFAWWSTGSVEFVRPWLSGQRVVFTPTDIDCGAVSAGTIIDQHVRVANLSSRPLTLTGAQQSCRCIALNEFPIVIRPRQEHQLDLKIGTPPNAGPFQQSVKIFFDDLGSSSVTVTVSAAVQ